LTLDDGALQANLSMDFTDSATARAYEVWPQILEKAFIKIWGWETFIGGGNSAYEIWQQLTNSWTSPRLVDTQLTV